MMMMMLYTASVPAPFFTVEPRSSVVRHGDALSVSCTASSTASPPLAAESHDAPHHRHDVISITWLHNGVTVVNQSTSSWSISSVSSRLYIASFSAVHEGLYQCVANNSLGGVISRPATLHLARQYINVFSGCHFTYTLLTCI